MYYNIYFFLLIAKYGFIHFTFLKPYKILYILILIWGIKYLVNFVWSLFACKYYPRRHKYSHKLTTKAEHKSCLIYKKWNVFHDSKYVYTLHCVKNYIIKQKRYL